MLHHLSRAAMVPNTREAVILQLDTWATLNGPHFVACGFTRFILVSTLPDESFWERVSYIPGWIGTGYVAEDGLELWVLYLPHL